MKVAFVGNMNNNFFAVARYARDRGIDAELLTLNDEYEHFLPERDSFETGHDGWLRRVEWGDVHSFYATPPRRVREDLAPYEFLVVCGSLPAFLHRIGRRADLFMPYGGDLNLLPFPRPVKRLRHLARNVYHWGFRRFQRRGIREVELLSQELFIPLTEQWLDRLGVRDRNYYLGFPMVYDREYAPETIARYYEQAATWQRFQKIRDENDLVVFHHSRHLWKRLRNPDELKNNHHLINGFAKLLERHRGFKACLVLFEYGEDVASSKELIERLGIADRVEWCPVMPRKEVMVGLSLCDIGAGEFGYGFFGGGTLWEILLSGKPLMTYRNEEALRGHSVYPIVPAWTEDQVCARLEAFAEDPAPFRETGAAGRRWTVEFFKKTIDAIEELVDAKSRGRSIGSVVEGWKATRGRESVLEW